MNVKKIIGPLLILLVVLIFIGARLYRYSRINYYLRQPETSQAKTGDPFDRKPSSLKFSKHAKCRMQCREITETEVKEILEKGIINFNKSRLNDDRGPSYALEGITSDKQHVRIVFAPKQEHTTVVTVIDLEYDHPCPSCD